MYIRALILGESLYEWSMLHGGWALVVNGHTAQKTSPRPDIAHGLVNT